MRRLLTNTAVMIWISWLVVGVSLVVSYGTGDSDWLMASGAVMTACGVVLAARKIIRLGIEGFMEGEKTVEPGPLVPMPRKRKHSKDFQLDVKAFRWSIALLVVGILIWAYGGILLRMFARGHFWR